MDSLESDHDFVAHLFGDRCMAQITVIPKGIASTCNVADVFNLGHCIRQDHEHALKYLIEFV